MRGGSLTRFKLDGQSGVNFVNEFKSLAKNVAKSGVSGARQGAKFHLDPIGGFRGAKRGVKRGLKRGALDIINKVAKRKLDDIFGQ